MLEGLKCGVPGTAQQFLKALQWIHPYTHHQRIHQEANHLLQLWAAAVGNRRANDDVCLSAVALQQQSESRKQRHVERGVIAFTYMLHQLHPGRRHNQTVNIGHKGLKGRTGPVTRQVQLFRNTCQLLPPVIEFLRHSAVVEPGALPQRKIRVLQL